MDPNMKAPSALVAVEDAALRQLLMIELEREGFQVFGVANGREALDTVRSRLPDLVLMDVEMPVMDGLEVARALRKRPETSGIPILVMSVLDAKEDIVKGLEAGAVHYITKPFFLPELKARMTSVLRFKRVHDGLAAMKEDIIRHHLVVALQETRKIIHETLDDDIEVIARNMSEIVARCEGKFLRNLTEMGQAVNHINNTVGSVDFLESAIMGLYERLSGLVKSGSPLVRAP
jgi:DNA-binding response OmpR family regulator